jgi:hypothetical protein
MKHLTFKARVSGYARIAYNDRTVLAQSWRIRQPGDTYEFRGATRICHCLALEYVSPQGHTGAFELKPRSRVVEREATLVEEMAQALDYERRVEYNKQMIAHHETQRAPSAQRP